MQYKFITENKDSHEYVDENTDNIAISTFFKQSEVSGMEFHNVSTSFCAIFIVLGKQSLQWSLA